jgi:hypothetical protein
MLELALDVASRLEEKIQLSCEVFINKAEVSHTYIRPLEIGGGGAARRSGRNFCRLHSFKCLSV